MKTYERNLINSVGTAFPLRSDNTTVHVQVSIFLMIVYWIKLFIKLQLHPHIHIQTQLSLNVRVRFELAVNVVNDPYIYI